MYHLRIIFGTLEIAKLLSIDICGLFYEKNVGKPKYWSTPISNKKNSERNKFSVFIWILYLSKVYT